MTFEVLTAVGKSAFTPTSARFKYTGCTLRDFVLNSYINVIIIDGSAGNNLIF